MKSYSEKSSFIGHFSFSLIRLKCKDFQTQLSTQAIIINTVQSSKFFENSPEQVLKNIVDLIQTERTSERIAYSNKSIRMQRKRFNYSYF